MDKEKSELCYSWKKSHSSYVGLLLFSTEMAAHSVYIRITQGEPEARRLMAERIQYEKVYQVRMGRAPAGKTDTLPVSDVRLQELGVTRAAPEEADEPGAAAEEDSDLEVFQDAASQLGSSDDSDEDNRRGRSREERLFLAAENKRAGPNTPTTVSRRMAADRITIDESSGPVHLAAEFWINPKSGNYCCPVAVCAGRAAGAVE